MNGPIRGLPLIAGLLAMGTAARAQDSSASASQACSGYGSPGTATVFCAFSYESGRRLASLLWEPILPAAWRVGGVSGDGDPETAGAGREIVFTGALTNNPVVFQFRVAVPPGEAGVRELRGRIEYQIGTVANPTSVWARPDPLAIDSHHRIDASAEIHGAIAPSGILTVAHGATADFAMAPDAYYHVSNVVVDAFAVGMTNAFTFRDVSADHTIRVWFAENLAYMDTPEWWLARHGWTNDFDAAAAADHDGDGMPAWGEWRSDTDPTNSRSVFRVAALSNAPPWTVYFGTSASRRYSLESSTNPAVAGAWFGIAGQSNVLGTGGTASLVDTNVGRSLFYRVRAQMP